MMNLLKKRINVYKADEKYCANNCGFFEDFMDYQQCALFNKKLKNKSKTYLPINIRCPECVKLLKEI